MTTKQQRLTARNEECRKQYEKIKKRNDKWRLDAVVSEVARIMFLSDRTVNAIISHEGIYNDNKPTNKEQLKLF